MIRRLLAVLSVTALACVLALRADAQRIKVDANKKEAPAGESGDPQVKINDAREQQQILKQEFEDILKALRIRALRKKNSDDEKDRAEADQLLKAIEKAAEKGTNTKFVALVKDLEKRDLLEDTDNLGRLVEANKELRKDLGEILEILRNGDERRLREKRQHAEEMLERLKDLIAKQERHQAQVEARRQNPEDLRKGEQKIKDETGRLLDPNAGKNKQNKAEGKDGGKTGKEGKAEGKDDTGEAKAGQKERENKNGEGKEGKNGEGKDSKEGKEGKNGEGKDNKNGKEGKPGEGKEGKNGEGKEGKPGDSKENKNGKPGEGKEGKNGEGKEGKPGQGKEGKPGEGKEGKPGQGKEGKPGDGKEGKPGQGKEGKPGEGKEGKPGDGKENKSGKPGEGKPGEGKKELPGNAKQGGSKEAGKPGDGKNPIAKTSTEKASASKNSNSKPSQGKSGTDSKGRGEGKASPKGESKSGSKPGQQGSKGSESKGSGKSGSSGQSGQQQQQQAGQSKGGGSSGQQQQQQQEKDSLPGRKQIQDSQKYQQQAIEKLKKEENDPAAEAEGKAAEKLKEAKKQLEDLLRQMRKEELERMLAALQARCNYMLMEQLRINKGTLEVDEVIQKSANKQPTRLEDQASAQLSEKEEELVREASKALRIIEADGTAVAFAEVFKQLQGDMSNVSERLRKTDTGAVTQTIENDIVATLQEMIEALKKATADLKKKDQKKKGGGGGGGGGKQDQKLIDMTAELKMIRSMQLRVNARTEVYGKQFPGEQVPAPEAASNPREKSQLQTIQRELKDLGTRQDKIAKITRDIATGKNEAK